MMKSSKKGFTLVEVMVTVALLSIVTTLCISLILIGINHSRQNAQKSEFQIGVNKFIAVINNRINSAGNGEVTVEIGEDGKPEFTIEANGVKEYYKFEEEGRITLAEDENGTNKIVIAPHIKDVSFTYKEDTKLLNIKVQSVIDEGWLETSFYIR